jgi:hypothetical protein
MSFYAKFDIQGVKKILEHSKKNPVFVPTFSQCYEAKHRKDGRDVEFMCGEKVTSDDVDPTTLAPSFCLVKDDGAYLMANTKERLAGEKTHNFVVYCEGCDPAKDEEVWDFTRQAFGGDDFSEALPLEWLEMAVENAERCGIDLMILKVTEEGIELMKTMPGNGQ